MTMTAPIVIDLSRSDVINRSVKLLNNQSYQPTYCIHLLDSTEPSLINGSYYQATLHIQSNNQSSQYATDQSNDRLVGQSTDQSVDQVTDQLTTLSINQHSNQNVIDSSNQLSFIVRISRSLEQGYCPLIACRIHQLLGQIHDHSVVIRISPQAIDTNKLTKLKTLSLRSASPDLIKRIIKQSVSQSPVSPTLSSLASSFINQTIITEQSFIHFDWRNQFEIYSVDGFEPVLNSQSSKQSAYLVTENTLISFVSDQSNNPSVKGSNIQPIKLRPIDEWCAAVNETFFGYSDQIQSIIQSFYRSADAWNARSSYLSADKTARQKIDHLINYPSAHTFLFHGISGSGKSRLIHELAHQSSTQSTNTCNNHSVNHSIFRLEPTLLYQRYAGEGEQYIRELFEQAINQSNQSTVSFILIDDVDSLCPMDQLITQANAQSTTIESSLLSELIYQIDRLNNYRSTNPHANQPNAAHVQTMSRLPVFVLMTTNRVTSLPRSLTNRIDQSINQSKLNNQSRYQLLKHLTQFMHIHDQSANDTLNLSLRQQDTHSKKRDEILRSVNQRLNGFVGADIEKICREVMIEAINRTIRQSSSQPTDHTALQLLNSSNRSFNPSIRSPATNESINQTINVTLSDFERVLLTVRPSNLANQELSTTPSLSQDPFEQFAGLDDTINLIKQSMINPIKQLTSMVDQYSSQMNNQSIDQLTSSIPSGLLLYGPPGCGKTSLGVATGAATGLVVLVLQLSSVVSKFYGDSEKKIKQIFDTCRFNAPCVLLIDEIDTVGMHRSTDQSSDSAERLLATLLQEIDGINRINQSANQSIYLIATTSRPSVLDSALCRADRVDFHVECPRPKLLDRLKILSKAFTKTKLVVREEDAQLFWDDDASEETNNSHPHQETDPNQTINQTINQKIEKDDQLLHDQRLFQSFLSHVAMSTEDCSAADLLSLAREAAMLQIRDYMVQQSSSQSNERLTDQCADDHSVKQTIEQSHQDGPDAVSSEYVLQALKSLRPSLRGVKDEYPPGHLKSIKQSTK